MEYNEGVTISKSLSWSIIVVLVPTVFWFGVTLSSISSSLKVAEDDRKATRTAVEAVDLRLRPIELTAPVFKERLDNISTALHRIESDMEKISDQRDQRER